MHIGAKFIGGASDVTKLPQSSLPEIAFLGRSNVGKSSFINRLLNQKNLARASTTPGRTQEVNIFQVTLSEPNKKAKELLFADLPGFGYAKVSKEKRESLSSLIVSYLEHRKNFSVLCLLNDIRRDVEYEEVFLRDRAVEAGIPLLVVLTKADKLSNNERNNALTKLSAQYNLNPQDIILTGDKISTRAIWNKILPLLS